jgi:REP element-mobilizing transposase RayT
MEIRKGRHVVYALHAHMVFVAKWRGKVFNSAHLKRLDLKRFAETSALTSRPS